MSYLIIVKEFSLSFIEQLKIILIATDFNINTLRFANSFVTKNMPNFVLWTFIILICISTIYLQISKHFLITGFWSNSVLNSTYRSFQVLDFFFFFSLLFLFSYSFKLIFFVDTYLTNATFWYNNSIIFDFYSIVCTFFLLLFFLFCIKLNKLYLLESSRFYLREYPLVLIFAFFFLLLLVSVFDFMLLFITLEGLSLTLYVLAAFDIKSQSSIEAGLKYFCLGSVASGFLGFGVSLLYGSLGTLNYLDIAEVLVFEKINIFSDFTLSLGLSLILFGFFFKLSIPPFHVWTPDVYEGSPILSTFFFSTLVKFGIFCSFIRVFFTVYYSLLFNVVYVQNFLLIFSLSAILVGSLGALIQNKFKRFLGYTAINQMGFILLGLTTMSIYGFLSAYLYLIIYVLLNTVFFFFLIKIKINNRPLIYFCDASVVLKQNFFSGILICLTLFSMSGIPPTIGFYIKFLVLKSIVYSGFFYSAVFVLFFNTLSTFYYIRLIKIILIGTPPVKYFSTLNVNLPLVSYSKPNIIKNTKNLPYIFSFSLNQISCFFSYLFIFLFLSGIWFPALLKINCFTLFVNNLWSCFCYGQYLFLLDYTSNINLNYFLILF